MKGFRIFVRGEPQVHFDFPTDMTMQQFMSTMMLSGYVATEQYYVSLREVKYILAIEVPNNVAPFKPQVV